MNPRTKIFVADHDCGSLVSLLLWLDQFPEFEVTGATIDGLPILEQVADARPDVIILANNVHPAENNQIVKSLKSIECKPAVLLRCQTELSANGVLEADGAISPKTAVKDLCDSIRKAANKRKVALSAANMPMTKAG